MISQPLFSTGDAQQNADILSKPGRLGGGVTAKMDSGLTLAARIAGEETAERIQPLWDYTPKPSLDAEKPDTAGPALTNAVLTARAPALAQGADQAQDATAAAHARLGL